uniref:Peroxiredoxin VI n=1 Tax=Laternula elliptica TaxID=228457 RepID=B3VDE7_LATEL|nr:peroxiredoxin VI [Laternula elliptica]
MSTSQARLNLGDKFPDFTAQTTVGPIKFHEWKGDSWAILFSHPADYTPVCTTELSKANSLAPEFEKRGVKMIALSIDKVEDHKGWIKDIGDYAGKPGLSFPIIADEGRELAIKFGMLDPEEKDKTGLALTCRAVFIIGPDHTLKLSMLYPATTGRNFTEILRVIDSLQLTMTNKVATPADWKKGEKCMVVPSVKPEDVSSLFPKGVTVCPMPSGKQYMRFTPDPVNDDTCTKK